MSHDYVMTILPLGHIVIIRHITIILYMSFLHLPSQTSVSKCQCLICHQQQSTTLFFLNHHHLRCPPTPHHHVHPQQPQHTTTQQCCNAMSPTKWVLARSTWHDEHCLTVMMIRVALLGWFSRAFLLLVLITLLPDGSILEPFRNPTVPDFQLRRV